MVTMNTTLVLFMPIQFRTDPESTTAKYRKYCSHTMWRLIDINSITMTDLELVLKPRYGFARDNLV